MVVLAEATELAADSGSGARAGAEGTMGTGFPAKPFSGAEFLAGCSGAELFTGCAGGVVFGTGTGEEPLSFVPFGLTSGLC
jgi:hypothetical protein